MTNFFKKINIKTLAIILSWLLGTIYLSFQYFRIADFPIGHDVINHIARGIEMQKHMDIASIFRDTIYPIPAVLFVWFYQLLNPILGWDWPRVFLFTECLYLSLTAILSGVFAWVIFKKWPILIATSFLVASSRWLGGSLYTGLMGEAFGWVTFIISLIFLYQKKWLWFISAFVLLAFSHPLPFSVLCIYLSIYLIFLAITQKKYSLLIGGFISLLALLTLGYFIFPQKRNLILEILQMDFPKEGEWRREYVIGSDFRRFNQYLFGVLGFLTLWLGKEKLLTRDNRNTLLLFSILSFLVTFKYLFGIHYLSFRYYTYFEIFNSLLAAFMIWHVANNLSQLAHSKTYKNFLLSTSYFLLLFLAVWPNTHATYLFAKSQLAENVTTTTPLPERTLIREASMNIKSGKNVLGQERWVWWFQVYGANGLYFDNFYEEYDKTFKADPMALRWQLVSSGADYVYLSSIDGRYKFEQANFLIKIYDKENIRLYEVK